MEYWWAERSISSMINEKSLQKNANNNAAQNESSLSSSPSFSTASSTSESTQNQNSNKENEILVDAKSINTSNYDVIKSIINKVNYNHISKPSEIKRKDAIFNTNVSSSAMNIAAMLISSSKSKMSSTTKSLQITNNLQPCFS